MLTENKKKEIIEKIKINKWEIAALVIILSIGIFLRTFHVSNWLHFEIDQTYDFNMVSPAASSGIENLPLLGPTAGGGRALRLGPAFYYMEYVSAKIFGNTPTGHAMNVIILSILSLPLFYFFCKRYFSKIESLGLLTIFSVSLYSVLYSRFSWSPNVLPFLILLSFYALLRSVSKQEKHPARWFLLSVATVTITSQIHFNAFFVIPTIAVIFTAIKRPRFNWKVWLSALAIIFVIYSPVILSDIKTNAQNLRYFKTKLLKTGTRMAPLSQTIAQNVAYNAYEYFFIATANDQINGYRLTGYGFTCSSCKENLNFKIFIIIIFLLALAVLMFRLVKEKDEERKNFLIIIMLWFLVSFYLFYSIAKGYRIYPRFFLLVSPLAIIFYGFILQLIKPQQNKKRLTIFSTLILLLVILNFQKLIPAFSQLQSVTKTENNNIEMDDIFPNTNRITLEQETQIVDYIDSKYQENHYPVYLSSKSEYEPAFWILLEQRGIHFYSDINDKALYAKGNYFDIRFTTASSNTRPKFSTIETKNFGTLSVYFIRPLAENITTQIQLDSQRNKSEEIENISKLLTWKKLFN